MADEKTVLIIDDQEDAIAIAEAILSDVDGLTTVSAQGGTEGLAKAKDAKPDLILLDVQMPDIDGFKVFSQLKEDADTAGIPVIMVTGVAEQSGIGFSADDMKSFLGKEPEGYIEKPVNPDELQAKASILLGL